MGLIIHYSLEAHGSDDHARVLVQSLHRAAQDLPFKDIGEVVQLHGQQCDHNRRAKDDPLRWLLIQAVGSVESKAERPMGTQGYVISYDVPPARVIAFSAWP